jgi:hypothetical protein
MAHERKEFCKNGHEIAVVGRNKSGNCKQCMREYLQDYYQNVTKPKLLGDKRVGKHRAHMSVIGRIKWWANKQLPARKSHDADVLVLAGCLYLGLPVFVILGAISITMTATQKG